MNTATNPGDGTFVVVENGQRVSAPTTDREAAEKEAAQRNRLAESRTPALPESKRANVKQNLMG